MAVFNNVLAGASGQAVGGYAIERSLRFNSSDSAYLSRTMSSASSTYTLSMWVKRSTLTSGFRYLFSSGNAGIAFNSGTDQFYIFDGGTVHATTGVYRDTSAWYHILLSVSSNTGAAYINGTQVLSGKNTASLSTTANATNIGRYYNSGSGNYYFDGYIADVYLIDGQALTPSSFTEVSATTGQLIPKAYSGTYGTNGFHLPFSDNSTAAALGTDTSGNSNTWTVNNISVAAGAGNDSLVDTPTSYGTDTGAGGEVRGNYATLNPLQFSTIGLSQGNLEGVGISAAWRHVASTIGVSSGKWYWEFTTITGAENTVGFGLAVSGDNPLSFPTHYVIYTGSVAGPGANGTVSGWANGDIHGLAFDVDTGRLDIYKNGILETGYYSGLTSGPYFPAIIVYGPFQSTVGRMGANFGQRPFAYTAPSGYKALCTTNLPAPVVAQPSTVMDVKLYTGNAPSTQTISGLGFSPDLVWIKDRTGAYNHGLFDVVRGANKRLSSSSTGAEITYTQSLTAFNSDGFSLGDNSDGNNTVNINNDAYVAWTWDAGSSTVTNTQGSITSSVRANASAGFSVATLTTPSSGNFTVGHGLNVAPSLVICKARNQPFTWLVYHKAAGAGNYLILNTTAAAASSTVWQNIDPSSTLVYGNASNWGAADYVMYSFAPVAGYSSFGSYTGNGSTDGPFIYTGFRPAFVMYKASSTTGDWYINDKGRSGYNFDNRDLYPDASSAESSGSFIDILSNGFKARSTSGRNTNGVTYIYCAFAESPFQYARAR